MWYRYTTEYYEAIKKKEIRLGAVLVIPALWEAEPGRSLEVRSSEPAWPSW